MVRTSKSMGGGKTKTSSSSSSSSSETPSAASTGNLKAKTKMVDGVRVNIADGSFAAPSTGRQASNLASRGVDVSGYDFSDEENPITPDTPLTPEQVSPVNEAANGAQAGAVSYDQAVKNLASGGLSGGALEAAQTSLAGAYGKNKYQVAHETLQGTTAPGDAGQAMSQVFSATPMEPDQSRVNTIFDADPVINDLMTQAYELLSPENTKVSLMDDYRKLYKESGLKDINEELIDAETIIDGTEDDIRNEIQTAGGLGTESQIQAMTLARNKGLLKRYNQLFAQKQSAEQQLNTMLNLTVQDRQMAQQRVQNQINTMFQFANFRQQAQNAVKEQYRWLVQTMGVDGLYNAYSNDPRQLSFLEKNLGVSQGGLQTLAAQAARDRALDTSIKEAQLSNLLDTGSGAAPTVKTINGVDMQWNPDSGMWESIKTDGGVPGGYSGAEKTLEQLTYLQDQGTKAKELKNESGQGAITKAFGDLVGGSKYRQLEQYADTLRVNMLALNSDPAVRKFFGPQMSNADVQLMLSGGSTLNPEKQSPEQLEADINRMIDLFGRAHQAISGGLQTMPKQQTIVAPDGTQVIIVD